jgi:hypothetical protein
VRETIRAKIVFHDKYWENVSGEGRYLATTPGNEVDGVLSAKAFISQLLEPDVQKRLTVEQAIKHSVRLSG